MALKKISWKSRPVAGVVPRANWPRSSAAGTRTRTGVRGWLFLTIGVAIGLANLFNKIAPLILLSGADYLSVFTKPQLEALALGLLNLNSEGNTVDSVFWGLWLLPCGILVIKSGFLPRILGILLMVAGFAYLTSSITSIVLPAYSQVVSQVTMPLLFGEFPIIFWLLIKGAKVPSEGTR